MIEIDEIRTRLGQWSKRDETKLMARSLALALTREHLGAGHDVIVPQYLGRPDFIGQLETVAGECGAEFAEIVLSIGAPIAADRFRSRRAGLSASRAAHPEADVRSADIEAAVEDAVARLARIARSWPGAVTVAAGGDVAEVCAAVDAALCGRS